MRDAVARHVPDGASVALGCALEPGIPFAFAHECIRQRKRDLRLIGPISDIAFDQLIGAGCVAAVDAAWVGNVSAGLAHCYRRAMEQGVPRTIEVHDHSNFTIAQALLAGALGAPYLPTRTLLGSDIPRANGTFREATSPFDGSPLLLVPAINPDVAVIASDPNRTIVPGLKVVAVVEEPGACHPSPLQGRYRRDHEFFHDYHRSSRTADGFAAWIGEWVTSVADRREYLARLGERWSGLREDGEAAAEVRY